MVKSMGKVNFIGQMVHPILASFLKTIYKEKVFILGRKVENIQVIG